jgi:pimeloyl-ACP methyl ester carboxylesterase
MFEALHNYCLNKNMKYVLSFLIAVGIALSSLAQVEYPYPVKYISLAIENKTVRMAYMDVLPQHANGQTFILFHGKNFNGYYWKNVIPMLTAKGFRVIVPDQVGWGKSDKADLHYSFHMLAMNNKILLDSLGVKQVNVLGHSMGGMLAIRFTLMFPGNVAKLVLEDPIGLEDYKTFVPYQPLSVLFDKERNATYESYKQYQQTYYPQWKPEYEQYVQAQAADLTAPGFEKTAWCNALTYQMIYEQPVIYEVNKIAVPVLLMVGGADRTIVGKALLSDSLKAAHGQYPQLAQAFKAQVKDCRLLILPGVGHIPHIQEPAQFEASLNDFVQQY